MHALPLRSAEEKEGTVPPKGKVQKEEQEVTEAVILLRKQQNPKNLVDKVVIEVRLQALSDDIRSRAEARLRQEQQPVQAREFTGLKIKPGATQKTKTEMEAERAKLATPDTKAVAGFMGELQSLLNLWALSSVGDAEGSLRKAATVEVVIPASCQPTTKAALQGVLTSIATTVARVFKERDTLVIQRSPEEIDAEQRVEDRDRRSDKYGNKVLSHREEYDKSKTVFGKQYERGRLEHYGKKRASLPKREDLEDQLKAAGHLRKKQIDEEITSLLDDLTRKVQTALAAAGGKDALPEGTDGGVPAMNAMIQAYVEKLTRDTEAQT
jgi:hypothetical protein